jgi:hypothetical protein
VARRPRPLNRTYVGEWRQDSTKEDLRGKPGGFGTLELSTGEKVSAFFYKRICGSALL